MLLAWHQRAGMQNVRRYVVEQVRRATSGHAGHYQLGSAGGSQTYRVRPRRADTITLHRLHCPAVGVDDFTHVVEVVGPLGVRVITQPAHGVPPSPGMDPSASVPGATDKTFEGWPATGPFSTADQRQDTRSARCAERRTPGAGKGMLSLPVPGTSSGLCPAIITLC